VTSDREQTKQSVVIPAWKPESRCQGWQVAGTSKACYLHHRCLGSEEPRRPRVRFGLPSLDDWILGSNPE